MWKKRLPQILYGDASYVRAVAILRLFFIAGVLEPAYGRPDRRDHGRARHRRGWNLVLQRVPGGLRGSGHGGCYSFVVVGSIVTTTDALNIPLLVHLLCKNQFIDTMTALSRTWAVHVFSLEMIRCDRDHRRIFEFTKHRQLLRCFPSYDYTMRGKQVRVHVWSAIFPRGGWWLL